MFLIKHIYNNNKLVSVIIVIETPKKKKLIVQKQQHQLKIEIVTNLLRPSLYKDKTNSRKIDIR